MKKYLVLNYKTYPQATGPEAIKLTRIANEHVSDTVELVICPSAPDMALLTEDFAQVHVWAQHIDPIEPGRNTGWLSSEAVKDAGGSGSLVNHSEHPLPLSGVEAVINSCHAAGLIACVCVANLQQARQVIEFSPDIIAHEPPELIATSQSLVDVDVSVAAEFASELRASNIPLLLGAGVRDAQDITKALELGYSGALLASGFVQAENPAEYLENLLAAFTA